MRLLLILMIAASLGLSACGRKNEPAAPDDVEETYPRPYPAPAPIPSSTK